MMLLPIRATLRGACRCLCGLVLVGVLFCWDMSGLAAAEARGEGVALELEVEGAISPPVAEYVVKEIRGAAQRGAALVILRMDTPGGLDTAMRDIIRAILSSPVPVATFVAPGGARAASAGTYILYASHLAAMAPGTNLGAATPIALGAPPVPLGEDRANEKEGSSQTEEQERDAREPSAHPKKADRPEGAEPAARPAGDRPAADGKSGAPAEKRPKGSSGLKDAMTAKTINDAVAYIRALAQLHGRNAEWAERAVREAVSLSAQEALEQKVIDLVARDTGQLLELAHGRTVHLLGQRPALWTRGLRIVAVRPDWRTRILSVLANPNVAFILMLLGIYGLLLEFSHPGAIAPGVVGAISLLLALFAFNLLPVNYAGVALLLLGLALMVAEAFVPAFGMLGLGGMGSFAMGALLLFDMKVPGLQIALPLVIGATLVTGGLLVLTLGVALRARRRAVVTGLEGLLQARGEVLSWKGDSGTVLVVGERWSARSHEPLQPGDPVRVLSVDGLVLTVERTPRPGAGTTHKENA
ncbi:MAG: nodulation protein NfeD [Myxococcales bacterium]|nr:nodulation protein NfeD [Myxococcota bacterium]MDW8280592.1 nodulation protein NfeD [Myxococcales bacterium]